MDYVVTRNNEDELCHHGVKGMKWGVRRKSQAVVDARDNYRSAKKEYNKSYNKAYNYSARHPITQWTSKKKSAEADRRWNDARDKAIKSQDAKKAYKQAKATDKAERKAAQNAKRVDKGAKIATKVQQKLAKTKMKDLQKQYGALEDKMTYGKNADTKVNAEISRELKRIENMMKRPTARESANERRGNF